MKKKNMKKLFASFALLAVAGAMAGTSTFAWFSMNRTVSAAGVGATARSAESLVIGKKLVVGSGLSIDFGTTGSDGVAAVAQKQLNPTTWVGPASSSYSGLKYIEGATIGTGTGKVEAGTATYVEAANHATDAAQQYYTDYVLYLAARGADLTGRLKVTFDTATIEKILGNASNLGLVGKRSTQKAYTLAFFAVADVTDETTNIATGEPLAKLSVADCFNGSGAPTVYLGTSSFTFRNQSVTADKAVKVLMRLYLDGDAAVKATDYLKADQADPGAGVVGTYNAGTTYYTYDGPGTGTFTVVGTNNPDDFSTYYVAATSSNYVFTDKVVADAFTMGVVFSVETTA